MPCLSYRARSGLWRGLSTVDDAWGRFWSRLWPARARVVRSARSLAPPWSDSDHIGERLGPGSTSAGEYGGPLPDRPSSGAALGSCQATTHPDRQEPGPPLPGSALVGRRLWFLPSLDPGAAGGHKKCTRRTFFPAETGLRLNGCRGEVICRRRGLATPRTDKSSRSRRSFRVSIVVLA
jgi:hypothetical protein